jgi:hypothetical protein
MSNKYFQENKHNIMAEAGYSNSYNNNRYQNNNRQQYRKPKWEVEQERKAAQEKDKKEKEEKNLKNCELTESNFPSLGAPTSKVRVWGGEKSFASMATEWEQQKKKEEEEKQKTKEEQNSNSYRRHNVPLPQFHNVRRFIDSEDETEEVEQVHKPNPNEDEEGWTVVDRKKIRREKTIEEKFAEKEQHQEENENTVWGDNTPQEHETCWDTRP